VMCLLFLVAGARCDVVIVNLIFNRSTRRMLWLARHWSATVGRFRSLAFSRLLKSREIIHVQSYRCCHVQR